MATHQRLPTTTSSSSSAPSPPPPASAPGGGSGLLSRFLFQRLLLLSLIRLVIYLNKLFQDCTAVNTYYSDHDLHFFIVSVLSLVCPPVVYAFYLIGEALVKESRIDRNDLTTKTVNGLLLIPWQIKRHLDVLHFVAQRICMCRSAHSEEREDIVSMQRNAEVLEFFEDFYAGFLQILLQLYILFLQLAKTENFTTKVLIGELIGSALCVLSMMIAVRRRDDGILTSILSFIGWLSLFVSRVIVFSLIASVIGIYCVVLALIHVLSMSLWIYSIALESHGLSSSSTTSGQSGDVGQWSLRKRWSMAIMVFLFFGLPSLLIWPVMFQLKEFRRPLKFLLIVSLENIVLLAIWFAVQFAKQPTAATGGLSQLSDTYHWLVMAAVIGTLTSALFLTGYVVCKPKLTDQVVLHKRRTTDTDSYGIYYEFCNIVFKLPNTDRIGRELEVVNRLDVN
ncbi:uncharacterized protein LOC128955130 [Oppia nitens]|uniref:uncharacterized protein LOC128955130 n=1 Tax=Oppia nitens TaxID=1686743 RepID=UPI0023DA07A5|nr:uncharacterized protein LOC128955130 [Oppia nitens]